MGLQTLYQKFNSIDFLDLAADVLIELDDYIADLNRSQMANEGVRADGTEITPLYTELTDFLKTLKGQETGYVTLKDSGKFHKSITAEIYGNDLVLDATDSKTNDLLDKYGEVLGLTEKNIIKLRAKFIPIYIQRIKQKLQ